jgi:hypothetical protein
MMTEQVREAFGFALRSAGGSSDKEDAAAFSTWVFISELSAKR